MSLLDRVFGGRKDDHYSKGMEYYTAGKYREAVEEFERVISSTQDHGNLLQSWSLLCGKGTRQYRPPALQGGPV